MPGTIPQSTVVSQLRKLPGTEPFTEHLKQSVTGEVLDGRDLARIRDEYSGPPLDAKAVQLLDRLTAMVGSAPAVPRTSFELGGAVEKLEALVHEGSSAPMKGHPLSAFSGASASRVAKGGSISPREREWRAEGTYGGAVMPALSPDADTLYVWNHHGELIALDREFGFEEWRLDTGLVCGGAAPAVSGDGRLLLVAGGKGESRLHAIDTRRKEVVWAIEVPASCPAYTHGSSPLFSADGKRAFLNCLDYRVRALDPRTGEVQWVGPELGTGWNTPRLSADGKRLYVSDERSLHALDAETGALKWSTDGQFGEHFGTPSLSPDGASLFTRTHWQVHRFDAETGKLQWTVPLDAAGGPLAVTPTLDGAQLLVPTRNGELFVLDPQTGEKRFRLPPDGDSFLTGAPAFSPNGELAYYLKDNGRYAAVDLENWTLAELTSKDSRAGKGFVLSPNGGWAYHMLNEYDAFAEAVRLPYADVLEEGQQSGNPLAGVVDSTSVWRCPFGDDAQGSLVTRPEGIRVVLLDVPVEVEGQIFSEVVLPAPNPLDRSSRVANYVDGRQRIKAGNDSVQVKTRADGSRFLYGEKVYLTAA